jgi:hypothetical protein
LLLVFASWKIYFSMSRLLLCTARGEKNLCIFAQQLQLILQKRQKHLGSLYSVVVPDQPDQLSPRIHPTKIVRLRKALAGDHRKSTTLNPVEIEAIQQTYNFTEREVAWLRAALAGEFVFRYILDRIGEASRALVAGDAVFHLLFDEHDEDVQTRRQLILDNVRARDEPLEEESTLEQKMNADLEPIIELYEEGLLCMEAAQMASNPFIRQGYEAMALSLLTNAQEQVTYPSDLVQGTAEQAAWQALIAHALAEVQDG